MTFGGRSQQNGIRYSLQSTLLLYSAFNRWNSCAYPRRNWGSLLGLSLIEPDDYSKLLLTNTPQKHAAVIVEAVSNKVKSEPDQYYDEFRKYLNTNHNLRYLQKAIEEKLSKLMSFY